MCWKSRGSLGKPKILARLSWHARVASVLYAAWRERGCECALAASSVTASPKIISPISVNGARNVEIMAKCSKLFARRAAFAHRGAGRHRLVRRKLCCKMRRTAGGGRQRRGYENVKSYRACRAEARGLPDGASILCRQLKAKPWCNVRVGLSSAACGFARFTPS